MESSKKKERIASRFKAARIQQDLTQEEIAINLGIHRPTVSYIEAGQRSIKAEELGFFARELKVPVEWLLG
jgi:transcriptional regulator with XRE-family HTH domain